MKKGPMFDKMADHFKKKAKAGKPGKPGKSGKPGGNPFGKKK